MGLQDLIISPLFILIVFGIASIYGRKLEDPELKKYFYRGLGLKIVGVVFISLVYVYYYGTGDSIYYFRRASFIGQLFKQDAMIGLKLIFTSPSVFDYETSSFFEGLKARDSSTYLVVRIAAFINLFSFNSYLGVGIIFTALSYIGIWRMFIVFKEIFPNNVKELAFSFLFLPSVFFWGSGILKDCLSFGFVGILISSGYLLLIKRENIFLNSILLVIGFWVVGTVKSYILMALLPAIAAWVFLVYRNKIKSTLIRYLVTPFVLIISSIAGVFILQSLASTFQKFSIDNFQEKAEDMQRWHTYRVEVLKSGEGSHYSLGKTEFTPIGVAKKIPAAINVALFRPYIWESKNPLVLLSALESLVLLYLSILAMWSLLTNFKAVSSFIAENPTILFMIIFSLIFAFSVGFTSFNFGALSRYRIPFLPLYLSAVLILRDYSIKLKKSSPKL
jgi:hypothetical protein